MLSTFCYLGTLSITPLRARAAVGLTSEESHCFAACVTPECLRTFPTIPVRCANSNDTRMVGYVNKNKKGKRWVNVGLCDERQ